MPNHSSREKDILTGPQQELADASRRPRIGTLDDDALIRLIASLEEAVTLASTEAQADGLSQAGLLTTAIRRAHSERRRRKLDHESATRQAKGAPVAAPAAKPAKAARRVPAVTRRVPSDRKTAETRKSDQRTGLRRVKKAGTKPEDTPSPPAVADTASQSDAPVQTGDEAKARRKAVKKAARQAEKAAEKEARKAARKAEKEAIRAARKAARLAAKEAERALRKAERKAQRKGDGDAPAKDARRDKGGKADKKAKGKKASAD